MRLRLGTLTLLAGASLLAGCGAFESQRIFDQASSVTPQGDAYHQSLYEGYMEHATFEQEEMMNYTSAISHSRNAMLAASGQTPPVAQIEEFGPQPADKVDELTQARARLVAALGAGGAQRDAQAAGRAQSFYACWVEQQHENFQPRDIAYCRNGFYKNLEAIEVKAAEMPEVIALQADILFDFDKATIRNEFRPELDKIADLLVQDTAANVLVWGFTDTAGPAAHNLRLSERRAESVAAYLEGKGVSRSRMTLKGWGETNLAVQTPDNTPEPRNRRVEIRRR